MKKLLAKYKEKPGSAIALTMFILAGMLLVALSGSYIILLGIKASGVQSQSTKAYFAAESGAEEVLWQLRKNAWAYPSPSLVDPVFSDEFFLGSSYRVYYTWFPPMTFTSIGEFNKTKRSVEIRL
ncbi:MAG: pilus assembly PilX N-terminal domain-containing protein [Candidatus Falkowbacteria bacterium]